MPLIYKVLGKFDQYRIDLKTLQTPSTTYEYVLDNVFFANIDGPDVQKGKVNVILVVKKSSHAFELDFQIDGIVLVPCDRCLDDMELPVSTHDKLIVKLGSEYAEEGDNLIVIPEAEGDINVSWFMYEFIALSVPMKHVHGPGKCNKTMSGKLSKHLRTNVTDDEGGDNEIGDDSMPDITMDNQEEHTDPRWDDLKKILDNN